MNDLDVRERLESKIMRLSQEVWENKVNETALREWLSNFDYDQDLKECEQLKALFLLSHFMYFGVREIRELLKSIFRDKFYNPLVQEIRKSNGDTRNFEEIKHLLEKEVAGTRFLGIGNPSESGTHLLYFFRQENNLSKGMFMHAHEIFKINRAGGKTSVSLKDRSVKRYVFIDDVCGSGTQAVQYSEDLVGEIKELDSSIEVFYYSIFSTSHGMEHVRENTLFDKVDCVFELDDTFKCFSDCSRYFHDEEEGGFSKSLSKNMCEKYGRKLGYDENHMLGFKNGQLLLGFYHNTPDNTLPIFWDAKGWKPIFKRYNKIYGSSF